MFCTFITGSGRFAPCTRDYYCKDPLWDRIYHPDLSGCVVIQFEMPAIRFLALIFDYFGEFILYNHIYQWLVDYIAHFTIKKSIYRFSTGKFIHQFINTNNIYHTGNVETSTK